MSRLKCFFCGMYLSVPPIYSNKGKSSCGRCSPFGHRNMVYEELAKFITFPCSHQNCKVLLNWADVQHHESVCPFKPIFILCPKHTCNLDILAHNILQHALISHEDIVRLNNFTVTRRLKNTGFLHFSNYEVYIINHQNEPYLVMVYIRRLNQDYFNRFCIYEFYFDVFYFCGNMHSCTKYDVDIRIQHGIVEENQISSDPGFIEENIKAVVRYFWHGEKLEEYNHNLHCFGCLNRYCERGHTGTPNIFLRNKITNIISKGDMTLHYKIKLY